MKLSVALRQALTIFTPETGSGNWFNSAKEACAVAAIGYVAGGLTPQDIKPWLGKPDCDVPAFDKVLLSEKMDEVPAKMPITKAQMAKFKTLIKKNMKNKMLAMSLLNSDYGMGVGRWILFLNDGCNWSWTQIADWLESNNL